MAQEKKDTAKRSTKKTSAKIQTPEKEQTLRIEVSKYTSLVNAMSGTKWLRMTVSVCLIGVFLFFCIFMVAFAIKKMYPYSDITTNGLGATTLKSEKGEVSYWLFNTASLWANSGITVEKGDIITIRSSGKYHTAIHHLYDAAKENKELKDEWIGSEGYTEKKEDKKDDYNRSQFRIFPGMPNGALIMQVVKDKPFDTPLDNGKSKTQKVDPDDFYYIGKERQHIYINNPGILHFAINDIVLNERTIGDMLRYNIEKKGKTANTTDKNSLLDTFNIVYDSEIKNAYLGKRSIGELNLGVTIEDDVPICELEYYLKKDYKTAWFDDNVGSLLILIEKESR